MDKLIPEPPVAQDSSGDTNPRRHFLAQTSLFSLGALAAITFGQASPAWAKVASTSTNEDIAILNAALGSEYQAIAAYQVGAESGLLEKSVLGVAVKFQGHHMAHAAILASTVEKLGGVAVLARKPAEYAFPIDQLKTQADVLKFAAGLEKGAASAYLNALPKFHNKDLTSAAGSILGDETMHWAILLNALGEDPVPTAFIG